MGPHLSAAQRNKVLIAVLVATSVPLLLLIVALSLTFAKPAASARFRCAADQDCSNGGICKNGTCICTAAWIGDACTVIANPSYRRNPMQCAQGAVPCKDNSDCQNCTSSTGAEFECLPLAANQSPYKVDGNFCLPKKPASYCDVKPCNPVGQASKSCATVPGNWYWEGWKDVETMSWTCGCEFGNYYPQDISTGACKQSSELCRGGKWQYPCIPNPAVPSKCESVDVDPTKAAETVGKDPATHGRCTCANADCTKDNECVSRCVQCEGRRCNEDNDCSAVWCKSGAKCEEGVCKGEAVGIGTCLDQRTALNTAVGVPTCVTDTCVVHCNLTSCQADAECANVCKEGATCIQGKCKGADLDDAGHWQADETLAPYTYGTCHCPAGCVNTGTTCDCSG
jgi:hypothetical protein